jgi:hypothetical protein
MSHLFLTSIRYPACYSYVTFTQPRVCRPTFGYWRYVVSSRLVTISPADNTTVQCLTDCAACSVPDCFRPCICTCIVGNAYNRVKLHLSLIDRNEEIEGKACEKRRGDRKARERLCVKEILSVYS